MSDNKFEGMYGGWTRYEGDIIYYIGDNANCSISIPAGKIVTGVNGGYKLTTREDDPEVADFDRAPVMGEQITITLRDAE